MIQAILRNGLIHPVSPLPADWEDGREILLSVVDDGKVLTPEELDEWMRKTNELAAATGPEEGERLCAFLAAEHEREKAGLRCLELWYRYDKEFGADWTADDTQRFLAHFERNLMEWTACDM